MIAVTSSRGAHGAVEDRACSRVSAVSGTGTSSPGRVSSSGRPRDAAWRAASR